MTNRRRGIAFMLAAVTCPCHVPLVAALLAGTAAGALVAAHIGVLLVTMALIFAGALAAGAAGTGRAATCASPAPPRPTPAANTASTVSSPGGLVGSRS